MLNFPYNFRLDQVSIKSDAALLSVVATTPPNPGSFLNARDTPAKEHPLARLIALNMVFG